MQRTVQDHLAAGDAVKLARMLLTRALDGNNL
jgi:hypothetical protein